MAGPYLKLLNSPYPRHSYKICDKMKFSYAKKIMLPNPIERDISYSQVISKRESRRIFNRPMCLHELSSVLWDVLKIKKINIDTAGTTIWNHRGAPSAGGLASVETFVLNIAGLQNSLYYYNPYDHSLEELHISEKDIQKFTDKVNESVDSQNATLFIYAAEITNLFVKYEHAESLLWRDVGAIYALANLAAESVGLNSCALGSIFHPLLSKILGYKEAFFGVGGQVFGHQ